MQDVEIRTDDDQGDVDLIVKVREKGRQQISLNGGISGIGGSFFGLEYSTNNLLGRGEILSFQFGLGNVQQSFQFTFQEPYFRDRPISVGFSLIYSRYKYLGEGTALTQNQDLLTDLFTNPNAAFTTDDRKSFYQFDLRCNSFCHRAAFRISAETSVFQIVAHRFELSIFGDEHYRTGS